MLELQRKDVLLDGQIAVEDLKQVLWHQRCGDVLNRAQVELLGQNGGDIPVADGSHVFKDAPQRQPGFLLCLQRGLQHLFRKDPGVDQDFTELFPYLHILWAF
ncbi:MAG: hypothetical protein R2864_00140 [Syntrophotaleaceae bacterium]